MGQACQSARKSTRRIRKACACCACSSGGAEVTKLDIATSRGVYMTMLPFLDRLQTMFLEMADKHPPLRCEFRLMASAIDVHRLLYAADYQTSDPAVVEAIREQEKMAPTAMQRIAAAARADSAVAEDMTAVMRLQKKLVESVCHAFGADIANVIFVTEPTAAARTKQAGFGDVDHIFNQVAFDAARDFALPPPADSKRKGTAYVAFKRRKD